jgi:hypothetical protein
VRRFFRDNGLSVTLFGLFLVILFAGQSWTGMRSYNEDQSTHGGQAVSYPRYLTTAHFGEATFENWESEFLQMGAYVMLTVWLRQRGSAESKPPDQPAPVDEDPAGFRSAPDAPWPVRAGGVAAALYRNSLSIAFFTLFAASFLLHAATGARELTNEQHLHGEAGVGTLAYMARSQFWFQSFQNWQSELLAMGSIVVLTIFLRQQGSPESKAVHAPHSQTGTC